MDEVRIRLEDKILEGIKQRIHFSQIPAITDSIILNTFLDFCNGSAYKNSEDETRLLQKDIDKDHFLADLQSYGIIDELLDDPAVEDIIVNGTEPIYVHYAREGLKKTDKRFSSLAELELLIKKISVFGGKQELKKINNIDLWGMRGRANIIYSPVGPHLTITKIKTSPLSIIDLIEQGTLSAEVAALLWLYVEGLGVKPANVLIAGGPGSGRTTLLNALLSFIPSDQHVVLIEDSMELVTHWIGSIARLESEETLHLAELVKNSLRMRPDRIIIGEVRGAEAKDMMTAMNIGKYCMATIHASSSRETIIRLQSEPMNVLETLINLIDVYIVMRKMKRDQRVFRVVDEIAESGGLEQKTVLLSYVWKFDFAGHRFNKMPETIVYRDRLSQASGLNGKQILEELERRKLFLEGLKKNTMYGIKDVSSYCEFYLRSPQQALSEVI